MGAGIGESDLYGGKYRGKRPLEGQIRRSQAFEGVGIGERGLCGGRYEGKRLWGGQIGGKRGFRRVRYRGRRPMREQI